MAALLKYRRGDTWKGVTFLTTYNGGAPPYPAASARLHFRSQHGVVQLSTSGDDPKLEITDAAAWTVVAKPHVLPIQHAGDWEFDLEIVDTQGTVTTTAEGTLQVSADVTQ